jgi:15-cis-phytoene synthase
MAHSAIASHLGASYEHCRRLHRRFDPTYYWATRRLPEEVRPAVHALYAFVRTADEIVDGPGRPPRPEARRAALDRREEELARAVSGRSSRDPVVTALVDAADRHELPLSELELYFESMRADCGSVRIATWSELERYMLGSAGSVGSILAVLLDVPGGQRDSFVRLALAFQLTNFIRDVRQDWELDRVYLPAEDLERFGVSTREIARRQPSAGFRRLLALQVGRARALFAESSPAAEVVSPGVRRGMLMARSVYGAVLDRAEHLNFDVLSRRTDLPPWRLAEAVARGRRDRG